MQTRDRIVLALKKGLPWVFVALMVGAVIQDLRGRGGMDEGKRAPQLRLALSDGTQFDLEQTRGHVRVINFWGTYCPPCRHEAPTLTAVWRELRAAGDHLIGVAADDANLADVSAFARQIGGEFPIAIGSADVMGAYRVQLLPTTYVIDGHGVITHTVVGEVSANELRAAIAEAREP